MTNDDLKQNPPPEETGSPLPPPRQEGAQTSKPSQQQEGAQTSEAAQQQKRTQASEASPRPRTGSASGTRKKATDDRVHASTAETAGAGSSSGKTEKNKSSKNQPKKEKIELKSAPARSERPAHRVIPYLLIALAVFIAVCLLLNLFCNAGNKCAENPSSHLMGTVGYYICYGLFGLFGPAVFALPILILNLALFWKTYIDNKLVLEKTVGSAVLLVLVSTMIHVFCLAAFNESNWSMTARELIHHGARMTFGGLLGGGLGYFFVRYLNVVGGIIISVFLVLLAGFFFLGMTPQHLMEHLRTKRNLKAAQKMPLGVDDEEYFREQVRQKHARAAAPRQEFSSGSAEEPPAGAVRHTFRSAPHKKDGELAPIPEPILDATDDTPERPLYVPKDVESDLAGQGKAPANTPVQTPPQKPAASPAAASVATSVATQPAPTKPAVPVTGMRQPMPSKTAQEDALDPIFPRNGVDARSVRRVQKSDRNFELGNIFINLDDHEKTQAHKHAPLPPEAPMPGSNPRSAPAPAAPAAPGEKPTAPAKPLNLNAAKPSGTKPGEATRPVQKPVYRPAASSGQGEFGLSNEEFEKREAASQAIARAGSAKAGAAPAGAKQPAAKSAAPAKPGEKAPAPHAEAKHYIFPPISYLHPGEPITAENQAEIAENMDKLFSTLNNFNVRIDEITYSCGPTVTRYEIFPSAGVRVRSIVNLADDIALSFAVQGVRMETIAGKSAIGVEVPNKTRNTVYLRDLIESKSFTENPSRLTAGLGADVTGTPLLFDIAKMPHLLVAGTTGSGKSICINCIIMSILFKARPDEVKLILIDPKKVEFSLYKGIPHLMAPIIVTPKDASGALQAAVNEMEDRFSKIQDVGVHDIAGYNQAAKKDPELTPMPHIVIIIDELADLMMTARDEVEDSICRLAQKARAAGMHIIVGTQRPSVDVVTGLIKSNIPSRIACTVRSQVDSRTILDFAGAEKLLGRGDMLFAPIGSMKPTRVQGAFVSDSEVEKICEFIRATNGTAEYNESFTSKMKEYSAQAGNKKGKSSEGDVALPGSDGDNKYVEAIRISIEEKKVSTSLLQRKLGIGYSRAAKIIDRMEEEGLVSKLDGSKPRSILISPEQFIERYVDGNAGQDEDI